MTTANQPEPSLHEQISAKLSRAYYNGLDKKGWSEFEEKDAVDKIIALFQDDKEAAVHEALEKLLTYDTGTDSDSGYPTVATSYIRDELDRHQSHPQASEADHLTQVSLCPTCNSVTHTHDGVCTRCGEVKAGEGEGK